VVLDGKILEKPATIEDNLAMLQDLNGTEHTIYTGVTVVQPQLSHPGYSVHSLVEPTIMRFAQNDESLLRAYAESGDGLNKGGSATLCRTYPDQCQREATVCKAWLRYWSSG
jgi:predicted house-cleaning NTP pyrophosphatase (Maf/HAM1 superfamily)